MDRIALGLMVVGTMIAVAAIIFLLATDHETEDLDEPLR